MKMESNKCPRCNSSQLDYCDRNVTTDIVSYEVYCTDCGFEGLECHSLTFQKFTDIKGNDIG